MNLIADRLGLLAPIQETEMLMCSAHEPIIENWEMSVGGIGGAVLVSICPQRGKESG